MAPEIGVVLQPPEGCLREEQVLRPIKTERLELSYRLGAVGRIVPGVRAVLLLRKVAGGTAAQVEQRLVTLRDDEDRRLLRGPRVDRVAHGGEELGVSVRLSAPMRLPCEVPLALEAAAILLEERSVLAGRNELPERGFAEVVNQHVLGHDQPQPCAAEPK